MIENETTIVNYLDDNKVNCDNQESQAVVCNAINLRVQQLTGTQNPDVTNAVVSIYTNKINAELQAQTEAKNQAIQNEKTQEAKIQAESYIKSLQQHD